MEKALDEKYAKGEKAFGFYCGGDRWTLLTLKDLSVLDGLLPGLSEASKSLDVTVLHTLVLEKLFGIDKENMANQVNLTYTRSFQEAVESVEKGESQCAFILNPHPCGGDPGCCRRRGKDASEIDVFLSQADHRPGDEPAEIRRPP